MDSADEVEALVREVDLALQHAVEAGDTEEVVADLTSCRDVRRRRVEQVGTSVDPDRDVTDVGNDQFNLSAHADHGALRVVVVEDGLRSAGQVARQRVKHLTRGGEGEHEVAGDVSDLQGVERDRPADRARRIFGEAAAHRIEEHTRGNLRRAVLEVYCHTGMVE